MTSSLPIPITILAGFLGSGKTTLLNRILQGEHGMRVAVLINDFGEVNIDMQLTDADQASSMVSLPNGCICCTLFGNLVEVLRNLTALAEPPDHIVIEASGVSQPHQIADILTVTDLQAHLRLDGVITLVDAENVQRLAEVVMFIEGQLRDADLILLNKTDLIDADELLELEHWIRGIAPEARIISTTYASVPLTLLLSVQEEKPNHEVSLHAENGPHHNVSHDRDLGLEFETWRYTSEGELDRQALYQAIDCLPVTVYRGKGFVRLADSPDQRTIVQIVGRRTNMEPEDTLSDTLLRNELVFIGARGALNESAKEAFMKALDIA